LTALSNIVAQTLVVQTITSSISSITGSTKWGSLSSDTHQFTGSLYVTGALYVPTGSVGVGTISPNSNHKLEVNGATATTGINLGNMSALGSLASGYLYIPYTGGIGFRSADGSAAKALISADNSSNLLLNSGGGFVGIGTTPGYPLTLSASNADYAASITNVQDSSQGLLVRATDNDTSLYLLNLQSSVGATSQTWVDRFAVTKNGFVGIGTNTPLSALHQVGGGAYYTADARFGGSNTSFGVEIKYDQGGATNGSIYCSSGYANNSILFKLGAGSGNTNQLVLTGAGNVLFGTATDPNAGIIVASQSANNWTIYGKNTSTTGTAYVFLSEFTGQAPNNTSHYFFYAGDTSVARFQVRSNGGIYNYSGNNVNLSDISTKKDITPCESYWDKFKAIEIVKFKYKDQTHDDFNIGVIAQQVEEVAPEFIDEEDWGKPNEETRIMKAVYTEDLHNATIKVLQEAMAKIETLEARVQELENK
jgi:hypothetical protein